MSWERTEGRGSGSGSKDLSNAVTWEQRPDCRGPRARQRSGRSIPDTQEQQDKGPGAGTSRRFEGEEQEASRTAEDRRMSKMGHEVRKASAKLNQAFKDSRIYT